jgi:hypothetical protein
MIERPPVSENSTPTFTSPAARAPVLKTHGEVINELPASNPFLRNLRLSTAITALPFVLGVPTRSRRSTLCRTEKFPDQIVPRERDCVGGDLTIHKQKSPTDPRGSLGLPSQYRTSNIDGPANVARDFLRDK